MDELPHIESRPQDEAEWFAALIALARYLRGPQGCPWDRGQRAIDFARFHGEEAGEYVEALAGDDCAAVAEEFGDALFTLLASAAAAESEGLFSLEEALRLAHEKMVRRHEHVFGDERVATAEEAVAVWKRVKEAEAARRQSRAGE